jgi:hypothetical protein
MIFVWSNHSTIDHRLQVSCDPSPSLLCSLPAMAPAQEILLVNHTDILLAYEKDYRQTRGKDRQTVMEDIIGEIASQGKGKFKQGDTKGLEQVSPFH